MRAEGKNIRRKSCEKGNIFEYCRKRGGKKVFQTGQLKESCLGGRRRNRESPVPSRGKLKASNRVDAGRESWIGPLSKGGMDVSVPGKSGGIHWSTKSAVKNQKKQT